MQIVYKKPVDLFDFTSAFAYNVKQVLLYPTIQTDEDCIISVTYFAEQDQLQLSSIGLGLENKE